MRQSGQRQLRNIGHIAIVEMTTATHRQHSGDAFEELCALEGGTCATAAVMIFDCASLSRIMTDNRRAFFNRRFERLPR